MNLQTLISQPNFTVDSLKQIASEKGLLVKEWKNRVLLTYPNKTNATNNNVDFNDPLVKECRGIVLSIGDDKSMKIVCYSMDKLNQSNDYSEEELRKMFDNVEGITEELYDGSLVKMYYFENQWVISTNRCIEARKARWANYRTFYDMFYEAIGEFNYETLDKRCTYSFVLCHPENRIVVNYQSPKVIHIATRNIDTLKEINVDIGIEKPLQLKNDFDTFKHRLDTNPFHIPGYVLKMPDGQRIVFKCKNYMIVKKIKGNCRDLVYRYLMLKREDEDTFKQFLFYFPEYIWVDSQLETLAREAHKNYIHFFVNHDKSRVSHRDLWELMSELHTLYLRTREPTSLMKVRQHLKSYPLDKLARLVNMKTF